jgi:hypothetical protein
MIVLLAALGCCAPAFSWPAKYTFRGYWRVPYTNLSNPITVVHEPDRQYQNQLNGVEQIWTTTAERHFHRKIVYNGSGPICYGYDRPPSEWDIEFPSFLPDPHGFVTQKANYTYRGRACQLHIKTVGTPKVQTWKMYTDVGTGFPVAYVAKAISLFDSHYDVYVLDIDSFVPDVSPGVWQLPAICTGNSVLPDPSPGNEFNLILPGGKDHFEGNVAKRIHGVPRFAHVNPKKWVHRMRERRATLKSLRGAAPDPVDTCGIWKGDIGVTLPATFTWRNVSNVVGKVRDQVACGSCWAFATAEAIESQIAIQTGVQQPISVNEIMDCTWDNQNYGCQGGDSDWAFSSMIDKKTGIALEKDYPYLGVSGMCNANSSTWAHGSQGIITRCWHIVRTKKAVQEALYYFGPLAIGIAVTEDMLLYTNGVFNDTTCTGASDDLVHAVLLTGWTRDDNGNLVWEVKNSWSEHWGDNGYVYVQGKDQEWNCGVTTDAVAVEVQLKSRP